eukprot:1623537-Prymnesium_polylepis.1
MPLRAWLPTFSPRLMHLQGAADDSGWAGVREARIDRPWCECKSIALWDEEPVSQRYGKRGLIEKKHLASVDLERASADARSVVGECRSLNPHHRAIADKYCAAGPSAAISDCALCEGQMRPADLDGA